jgi:hypothetical protein
MPVRRRIKRTGSGFRLNLPDTERELLAHLVPQLRDLIANGPPGDERIRRLFPTAYPDDPEKDAEYQRYMREELVTSRLSALDTVERTVRETNVTEADLVAWMGAINGVRLVLGTMLDISEELDLGDVPEDDPNIGGYTLYGYLSMLLEEIVQALGD